MSPVPKRSRKTVLEKEVEELLRESKALNTRLACAIEKGTPLIYSGEYLDKLDNGTPCNSIISKLENLTSVISKTNTAFQEIYLGGEFHTCSNSVNRDGRVAASLQESALRIESFIDGRCFYKTVFSDCHPVVTPWTFTLRREANEEFEKHISALRTKVQNGALRNFAEMPKSGAYVIGYEEEHCFRALVTHINNIGLCYLFDVDSGKLCVRPVEMLWQIDEDCTKVPCQAISCSISGLPRKIPYWSMTLSECFRKLLKQFHYCATIMDKDEGVFKYKVHLKGISGAFSFDVNRWVTSILIPFLCKLAANPEVETNSSVISLHPKVVYSEKRIMEIDMEVEDPSLPMRKQRNVSANDFFPVIGEIHSVYLSKVISPDEIYVHVISPENAKIDRLEELLKVYFDIYQWKFQSKDICKSSCKQYCVVQYDNRWFRAKITDWLLENDHLIELFLFDYGMKILCDFKLIQPLVDWLMDYPQYAILCKLPIHPAGCETAWSNNSLRALCSALNVDDVYRMSIVGVSEDGDVPYVSLVRETDDSGIDVSKFMVTNGYAKASSQILVEAGTESFHSNVATDDREFAEKNYNKEAAIPEKSCHRIVYPAPDDELNLSSSSDESYDPVTYLDLPDLYKEPLIPVVGSKINIVLSVMESIRSYYCIINNTDSSMSSHLMLKHMNEQLSKCVRRKQLKAVFNPFFGEIVVAQFKEDGQWYRARIIGHVEESLYVKIFFVDYGNIQEVNLRDLRKIKKEFLKLPFQAVKLFVNNIPQVPCKILNGKLRKKFCALLGKDIEAVVDNITPENEIHVRLFTDGNRDLGEVVTQMIVKGCSCSKCNVMNPVRNDV